MQREGPQYRTDIQKMMYIHGEVPDPLPETTDFIKTIVHEQMIEIIKRAADITSLRSSQQITPLDIVFVIRHNKQKETLVQKHVKFTEIRKTIKCDRKEKRVLTQEEKKDSNRTGADLILPGYTIPFLNETVIKCGDDSVDNLSAANDAYQQRLADADERTRNMSEAEYAKWTGFRRAWFTKGRKERFGEWLGLESMTGVSLHDDVFEVLSLLAFDVVVNVTKEALRVKEVEVRECLREETLRAFNDPFSLRSQDPVQPDPLQVRHVRDAFNRLRVNPRQGVANLLIRGHRAPNVPDALVRMIFEFYI
ncbi:TFIID-18kDa-domain-containing protein [Aspergillus steynii IBT 23096]|uniref:TFIID-18kDa-domain-containing protein n=1 Tax=Aspergillus steynii IBT 23096 TaxID=1392250 RepID=A0A2I2GHU6_9EURO|nr:TFIID-18kDa-domain-containing protein [Aspergillus steynii IBT 23096]PLB52455.1 TFIID-18kDa-domain-containing protein [Aspergillus steynii IBT 23096]